MVSGVNSLAVSRCRNAPAVRIQAQTSESLWRSHSIARLDGVAKVWLKVSSQVIESAHSLRTDLCVAYVIPYETCQELYFQPFARLEGHSAPHLKNRC
jgi:hypothetical protein